jgi:hypothetical protein
LNKLGLSSAALRHGIQREIFWLPLAENAVAYLNGDTSTLHYYEQSFDELTDWWRNRWLLPRAERVDGWHLWDHHDIGRKLTMQ